VNVLLDANVLYSIVLTDVLLTLAEDELVSPLWTERILDEAQRNLAERGFIHSGRRFAAMQRAYPTAMIPGPRYEHLIPQMTNHPGDRHVLAAAVAYRVDAIVTHNVKHFPTASLSIDVVTPDALLCALHEAGATQVMRSIDRLPGRKRRPPMTVADVARRLERSGAVGFADRLASTSSRLGDDS
jgi:hypothetical protein